MKKHKHCELIKAWADGAEIQYKSIEEWKDFECLWTPSWSEDIEYRIKPEPKPDISRGVEMNPIELADELNETIKEMGKPFITTVLEAATMLRQLQAENEALVNVIKECFYFINGCGVENQRTIHMFIEKALGELPELAWSVKGEYK